MSNITLFLKRSKYYDEIINYRYSDNLSSNLMKEYQNLINRNSKQIQVFEDAIHEYILEEDFYEYMKEYFYYNEYDPDLLDKTIKLYKNYKINKIKKSGNWI